MRLKNLKKAVRVNSDFPSITQIDLKTQLGDLVSYQLISIPFYLISEIHRLLDDVTLIMNLHD